MTGSAQFSLKIATRERPQATALLTRDRSISYADWFRLVTGFRARGKALFWSGIEPIAFVADQRLATLGLLYWLLEDQRAFVPLHPAWHEAEQRALVERCGALWLRIEDDGELVELHRAQSRRVLAPSTACVLATSGSTGLPKLVELARTALEQASLATVARLGGSPEDRWLWSLGAAHIGGLSIVLRCLTLRSTLVLADAPSPVEQLAQLHAQRVSVLSLVPTQLTRWLAIEGASPPPSLRAVLLGGMRGSRSLVRRARAGGWPILTTFGMTETCAALTLQPLSEALRPPDDHRPLDAGLPLDGVELRIVEGELQIRGQALLTRYLGEPRAALDPAGWFPTGDLAELDDQGRLIPVGRRLDRIVTGGENVAPSEVERVLERQPHVEEACVVGVSDPEWGERVAAVVRLTCSTRAPGSSRRNQPQRVALLPTLCELDPQLYAQLEAACLAQLARFKRPRHYFHCTQWPLQPSGKLDRQAIIAAVQATIAARTQEASLDAGTGARPQSSPIPNT